MKYLFMIIVALLVLGCAQSVRPVEVKEVYLAQKTEVNVVSCDTKQYHERINTLLLDKNTTNTGSEVIDTMWQLIAVLYGCIDRQRIEIESKK